MTFQIQATQSSAIPPNQSNYGYDFMTSSDY